MFKKVSKDFLEEQTRLDRLKMESIRTSFVNRNTELEILRSTIEEYLNDGEKRIIVVEAPEGMGKTWLIKYMAEEILASKNVKCIFMDASRFSNAFALLKCIKDEFIERIGLKTVRSDLILEELKQRVILYMDIAEGTETEQRKERFDLSIDLSDAIQKLRKKFREYAEGLSNLVKLTEEKTEILYKYYPIALAADLNDYLTNSEERIILIMDSIQRKMENFDMLLSFLDLLDNILIIITVSFKIEKLSNNPQVIKLGIFQRESIEEYVGRKFGLHIDELTNSIFIITRGIPLYLGLLGDDLDLIIELGKDPLEYVDEIIREEKITEDLMIERIIEHLPEDEKNLLARISLSKWFTEDLINYIVGDKEKGMLLTESIISFSFIQPLLVKRNPWSIHKIMRERLLKLLKADESLLEDAKNKLLSWFSEKYNETRDIVYLIGYLEVLSNSKSSNFLEELPKVINRVIYSIWFDEMVSLYNEFKLQLDSLRDDYKALLSLALMMKSLGLLEKAYNIFTGIVDSSTFPELVKIIARRNIAQYYLFRGLYGDVINIVKVNIEKLENEPLSENRLLEKARNLYLLGKAHLMRGDVESAMRHLEEVLEMTNKYISLEEHASMNVFLDDILRTNINSDVLMMIVKIKEGNEAVLNQCKRIIERMEDLLKNNPHDYLLHRAFVKILHALAERVSTSDDLDLMEYIAGKAIDFYNALGDRIIDNEILIILSNILNEICDMYLRNDQKDKALLVYKLAYDILERNTEKGNVILLVPLVKILDGYIPLLMETGKSREALEILIHIRGILSNILEKIGKSLDVLTAYIILMRRLGKTYLRLNRFSRAVEILENTKRIVSELEKEGRSIDPFFKADILKDLARAYLIDRKFEKAFEYLSNFAEYLDDVIISSELWRKIDAVRLIFRIIRVLRSATGIPTSDMRKLSEIIGKLIIKIMDKLIQTNELPENPVDYIRILGLIIIALAKLWYSVSMFDILDEVVSKGIESLSKLYELSEDEELRNIILSQKFRLYMRHAIVKFFAEMDIEEVMNNLNACRDIIAELEGKLDPLELAYMKCDLVLFDSRVKNSLREFKQSLLNIEDFLSILSSIPVENIDKRKARELIERAKKAIRDIRILTERQIPSDIKSTMEDLERELKGLENRIFKAG